MVWKNYNEMVKGLVNLEGNWLDAKDYEVFLDCDYHIAVQALISILHIIAQSSVVDWVNSYIYIWRAVI